MTVENIASKFFVISGPSGVGKDTLIEMLQKHNPNLPYSVSVTTREPRPGEIDGVHYHYLSEKKFLALEKSGGLLESAKYGKSYYGTPEQQVVDTLATRSLVAIVEVNGARQIKTKMPEAVTIFIKPPSLKELERRLRGRNTESEEKIKERLFTAQMEIAASSEYDYVLPNDNLDRACQVLNGIYQAETHY